MNVYDYNSKADSKTSVILSSAMATALAI